MSFCVTYDMTFVICTANGLSGKQVAIGTGQFEDLNCGYVLQFTLVCCHLDLEIVNFTVQ